MTYEQVAVKRYGNQYIDGKISTERYVDIIYGLLEYSGVSEKRAEEITLYVANSEDGPEDFVNTLTGMFI